MPKLTFDELAIQLIRTHPEDYWSRGDVLLDIFAGLSNANPVDGSTYYSSRRWAWQDGRALCMVEVGQHAKYGSGGGWGGRVLPDYLTYPDPMMENFEAFMVNVCGRGFTARSKTYRNAREDYDALCRVREEAEERALTDRRIFPRARPYRLDKPLLAYDTGTGNGTVKRGGLLNNVPDLVEPDYLAAAVETLDILLGLLPSVDTMDLYLRLHQRHPASVPAFTPRQAVYAAGFRLRARSHRIGNYNQVKTLKTQVNELAGALADGYAERRPFPGAIPPPVDPLAWLGLDDPNA